MEEKVRKTEKNEEGETMIKSKSVWFNVIMFITAISSEMAGSIIPREIATAITLVGNVVIKYFQLESIKRMEKIDEIRVKMLKGEYKNEISNDSQFQSNSERQYRTQRF